MSFLSRIKDIGQSRDEEEVQPEALAGEVMVTSDGAQSVDTQQNHSGMHTGSMEESIISEAAPSEFPLDYNDTRMRADADHLGSEPAHPPARGLG